MEGGGGEEEMVAGAWMETESESSPTGQSHSLSFTGFCFLFFFLEGDEFGGVQTSFQTVCFDCVTLAFKH